MDDKEPVLDELSKLVNSAQSLAENPERNI